MEVLGVFLAIFIVVLYLGIIGVAIANYVMTSLGLYRIAQRRRIQSPWMAWVPFVHSWLVGKLAGEYDERNGQKRPWGKVLLILKIISAAGFLVTYITMIIIVSTVAMNAVMYRGEYEINATMGVGAVIVLYVLIILIALAGVAAAFCEILCIFKIFESTVPEKALKYILIYLMVPLGAGICLLKCKDKGYPEPPMWRETSYQAAPEKPE